MVPFALGSADATASSPYRESVGIVLMTRSLEKHLPRLISLRQLPPLDQLSESPPRGSATRDVELESTEVPTAYRNCHASSSSPSSSSSYGERSTPSTKDDALGHSFLVPVKEPPGLLAYDSEKCRDRRLLTLCPPSLSFQTLWARPTFP